MTTSTSSTPTPGWKIIAFIIVVLGGAFVQYKYDVYHEVVNALHSYVAPVPAPTKAVVNVTPTLPAAVKK